MAASDTSPHPESDLEQSLTAVHSCVGFEQSHAEAADIGYELLEELGRGGAGVVYRARDPRNDRYVAVKALQRLDPETIRRFKNEFRAMADIMHVNLATLYELISDGRRWFLVMELLDGVSFIEYVRRGIEGTDEASWRRRSSLAAAAPKKIETSDSSGSQSGHLGRIRRGLAQLAAGVAALHTAGVLHRDIKPSNIRVTHEQRVVLLDFGLAAEVAESGSHQTNDHHVLGTVGYMAPEQARGEAVTPASDLYSVGVVLYEGLTGGLPFAGNSLQTLADKQQRDPPPPSEVVAGVPRDLNRLCMALLCRRPLERPTAQQVLNQLGQTSPVLVSRASPAKRSLANEFAANDRYLETLLNTYAQPGDGSPRACLIHGLSGAGKSTLAARLLEQLRVRRNAVVLSGRCFQHELLPFKAVDSMVDALSDYLEDLPESEAAGLLPRDVAALTRMFPVLERVKAIAKAPRLAIGQDDSQLRRRAFMALRELLARIGDRRPLVIFIDDLQWGDEDSADLLAATTKPPNAPSMLLLGCYRSDEVATSPFLKTFERLVRQNGAEIPVKKFAVTPLETNEAESLVRRALSDLLGDSQQLAERIARESRGNLYLLTELIQSVRNGQSLATESQAPAGTLDEIFFQRTTQLPPDARRLLRMIAVSGKPMPLQRAFNLAGIVESDRKALSRLVREHFARVLGSGSAATIETYHDRIREAVTNGLADTQRRAFHRKIAEVLEQEMETKALSDPKSEGSGRADEVSIELMNLRSDLISDLSYHLDAAGLSKRALPYALKAAEQARRQSSLAVSELQYTIAARNVDEADMATQYRVAEGYGDVLMLRGRYDLAAAQFELAMSMVNTNVEKAHVLGKLGELAHKQGDMDGSAEATERAIRLLGRAAPRSRAAIAMTFLREALVQCAHSAVPQIWVGRRSLSDAGVDLMLSRLYARLSYAYWYTRGTVTCVAAHLRGMNLAERYPDSAELGQAYSLHAVAMSLIPWQSRGIRYAQQSLEIRQALNDVWGQGQTLHFRGIVLYACGRYHDCIETCREAVEVLEQAGDPWEVHIARWHIAASRYRLGDLAGAIGEALSMRDSALRVGDELASRISLDIWSRAALGQVSAEAVSIELGREQHDVQGAAQILLAEGLRLLLGEGLVEEAVDVLEKAQAVVDQTGIRNQFLCTIPVWRAAALRRAADQHKTVDPQKCRQMLIRSRKAIRRGLRLARWFRNDLPHALREKALLEASDGRLNSALRLLAASEKVAVEQGAYYEESLSLLERGRIRHQIGHPRATLDIEEGRRRILEIEQAATRAAAESKDLISLRNAKSQEGG